MSEFFPSLRHHFLIAMPNLDDPNFAGSIVYVCEHTAEGAMGIIVNRPLSNVCLRDIFQQMNISCGISAIEEQVIFLGGPMQQERGFVFHRSCGEWHTSIKAENDICITLSRDILEAIAQGKGPQDSMVTLGYAAWTSGQLDLEMINNVWLNVPAIPRILFDIPYHQRWQSACQLMGFDYHNLSSLVGHG